MKKIIFNLTLLRGLGMTGLGGLGRKKFRN